MTWTGADSGYEGTLGPNSGPLYAIAVERGAIVPPDPEWWLAEDRDTSKPTKSPNNAIDSDKE